MDNTELTPTDAIEIELLRQIGSGSEDAFVELYRRRQQDVYRFAFAMSKSSAVADDVTQEVFLAVLQNVTRFDAAKGSVRAWLFGCARHVILDRMRRESRWTNELPEEPSIPCQGEEDVLKAQRLAKLHAAIVGLPIEYREAIILCELAELSYAESAAVLSCPVGTIRSRLHRAKALLAIRLGELAPRAATQPGAQPHPSAAPPAPLLTTREVCS